jgi:hypothetical protein
MGKITNRWFSFAAIVSFLLCSPVFQNCSPAQMSTSGSESDGSVGGVSIPPGGGGDVGGGDSSGGGGGGTNPPGGDCTNDPPGSEDGCGPNLVANGDFEILDGRTGLVHGHKLDELAVNKLWDVYGALPGEAGDSWQAEAGTSGIEVQASTYTTAASGKHYVELDSHPNPTLGTNVNSGMHQTVTIKDEGRYILSFLYRGRTNSPGDNGIEAYVDDSLVGQRADGQRATWQKIRIQLRLGPGAKRLLFKASGAATTYGGLIDRVSLRAVCR